MSTDMTETKKIYQCFQCEYVATCNSNLQKHVWSIHEKRRPYECDKCDYKAAQKSTLKDHQKAVHEKSRLHCLAV